MARKQILNGAIDINEDATGMGSDGLVIVKPPTVFRGWIEFSAAHDREPTQVKQVTFQYVSDTELRVSMRGADGITRSTVLTLA